MNTNKYDCLIIGYNAMDFEEYLNIFESMGTNHHNYRDLNVNYITYNNKSYQALDIFNNFYFENKKIANKPFHNADVLAMVILYLGTFLSKNNLSFDYINNFHFEKEQLKYKLLNNSYLTIAISTTNYTFDNPVTEIISYIKKFNKKSKIVVGGPLIYKRYEKTNQSSMKLYFKHGGADIYVYSREGEQNLSDVINALKFNRTMSTISNIAYKFNGEFVVTPSKEEFFSLEENIVDYSLFPKEDIGEYINLRISKGCHFYCSFCAFPVHSTQRHVYSSIEHVKCELELIKKAGVKSIFFIDGTVNVPSERFKQILRMMVKEDFDFKWNCFFRCDYMDEEMLELMEASGCEGVYLGLESADSTLRKNMNKSVGIENFRKAIPMFKDARITTFVSIIVGFPGETIDTYYKTIEFLREINADFYRPQIWFCDPMTPIWKRRKEFGIEGYSYSWKHNTMDVTTACELFEESFLMLDKPIWLPDPGYNFNALYLLRQRGISIERQKIFLKCFNAIVKEKLLYPNKRDPSIALMENLKRSCQVEEGMEVDKAVIELMSDGQYIKTVQYLEREYSNDYYPNKLTYNQLGKNILGNLDAATSLTIDSDILNRIVAADHFKFPEILFFAFGMLLSQIQGERDANFDLIIALPDHAIFPFRFQFLSNQSYTELAKRNNKKFEEALEYHTFSLHILTNPLWEKKYKKKIPIFSTGFIKSNGQTDNLERVKESHPTIYQNLHLVIKVNDVYEAEILYSTVKYNHSTIEEYKNQLRHIFDMISSRKDLSSPKFLNRQADRLSLIIEDFEAQDFNI